jgi:ferredoxin
MSTEYRVRLDRGVCEGIFACLVRDERFREAADGLAALDGTEPEPDADGVVTATFDDDRLDAARSAARACPVDAIAVTTTEDEP